MKRQLFFILALIVLMASCYKNDSTGLKTEKLALPDYVDYSHRGSNSMFLGDIIYTTQQNKVISLGRVLFYDKNLSANNAVACASCHQQSNAFADPGKGSTGFTLGKTERNSMAIVNIGDDAGFFWDLRELKLEEMVLKPALNHVEMGFSDLPAIVSKIASVEHYPALFEKAFGDRSISSERIGKALAAFVRALHSTKSKFDNGGGVFFGGGGIYNQQFNNFSPLENLGKIKFNEFGCSKCHGAANDFTSPEVYANIGLDMNYKDKGVNIAAFVEKSRISASISNLAAEGYFKVPRLRNVQFTAPYMHDGRFATLDEVLEHYNSGVKNHPDLSWQLKDPSTGAVKRLHMTRQDKEALKAFLFTLSDEAFLTDPRYATPFIQE